MNKLHQCWNLGKTQEFGNYLAIYIDQMDFEKPDRNGRTALWLAAAIGNAPSVQLLLRRKADKEARCPKTGYTPLLAAVRMRQADTTQALLRNHVNVDATDGFGNTPLMLSAELSDPLIARLLLNAKANLNLSNREGVTALMIAANRRRTQVVGVFLKHDPLVNMRDKKGKTALMYSGNIEIVQKLLDHNADQSLQDYEGRDVYAYMKGRTEAVDLLIASAK